MAIRISLDLLTLIFKPTLAASLAIFSSIVCIARFVRDKDVILTSDYWRVVVNFDLTAFEEAIKTLHEDLTRVKALARRTKPIGELRQVEDGNLTVKI
jgi:hypothetical protein